MVLSVAFTDSTLGVRIHSKLEANLIHARQFKFAGKTRSVMVHKLMFTDEATFVADNHQNEQEIITRFSKSTKIFGLKLNLNKIEIIYRTLPGSHYIGQDIEIDGQVRTQINKFKYQVPNDNRVDTEQDT